MSNENGKKVQAFNLGVRGWIIVALGFITAYAYSCMTSDILNVTVPVWTEMGLNSNLIYGVVTVGCVIGLIVQIICGKLTKKISLRVFWAVFMLLSGIMIIIWGLAKTNAAYAIPYLVIFACLVTSTYSFSMNIMANWFPKKRGVALGVITAGYPLSAATGVKICANFISSEIGMKGFYFMMGVIVIIVGLLVLAIVRDFPEECGLYPDNNRNYDFEQAKAEHEKQLEYLKTSYWTSGNLLKNVRMWMVLLIVSLCGFVAQGMMASFLNYFVTKGYEPGAIMGMLAICGLTAIPLSVFWGWVDVKFGSKVAGMCIYSLAVVMIIFQLSNVHILHMIGLPLIGSLLGGSVNMMGSFCSSIWGRYDFQNAYRIVAPAVTFCCGIGVTAIGLIGTNVSYNAAFLVVFALLVISFVLMCFLKTSPIEAPDKK